MKEMAAQMTAAVLHGREDLRIEQVPMPKAGQGEIVVRVHAALTCGTDLKVYRRGYHARMLKPPIPFGHELAGTVHEVGEGVTAFRRGDRVVALNSAPCGDCYYCRHDFPYYFCQNMTDYGNNLSAADPPHLFGGWSQYMYIVPGSFLVRVPDDLPSEVAVLTEVMAVTVGLDRAKQMSAFPSEAFLFDDTVVVLGVGPLGMCFLMKARMLGAGNIIAVDLSDYRLQFAKRLGADHVLNVAKTTLADRLDFVRGLTQGRGADMVIETAGVPQAVPEGLELLRLGGLLLEAGNFSDLGEVPINPFRHLCSKSVRILGVGGEEPAGYGPSMRQMARYAHNYPLREFVSHRFPLREVEAAVQKAIGPDSMKVAMEPWA